MSNQIVPVNTVAVNRNYKRIVISFLVLLPLLTAIIGFVLSAWSIDTIRNIYNNGKSCTAIHDGHSIDYYRTKCSTTAYTVIDRFTTCVHDDGKVQDIEIRNYLTPCFMNLGDTNYIKFNKDTRVIIDPNNDKIGYIETPFFATSNRREIVGGNDYYGLWTHIDQDLDEINIDDNDIDILFDNDNSIMNKTTTYMYHNSSRGSSITIKGAWCLILSFSIFIFFIYIFLIWICKLDM